MPTAKKATTKSTSTTTKKSGSAFTNKGTNTTDDAAVSQSAPVKQSLWEKLQDEINELPK
jgi:hypothetical protein